MSIKNLFGKTSTSYQDTATDVESTTFIDETVETRETYIPPLDFSDPKNFVYYGSAELYYDAAIRRIYEDYPYDGSKAEQLDFEQKASHLERYIFENKYPKTTGHVQLGTTGATTGSMSGSYTNPTIPEYIEVHGGLHIDSTATNLDDHFEHSAKYDAAKNRTQNFNCDFTNKGITIEFWMKKSSYTSTNKEVILDLWNGVTVGAAGYSRVVVETFDDSGTKKMAITIATGGTSDTSTFVMGTTETDWNHYAFSVIDGDSNATVRFYTNGEENSSDTLSANFAILSGRLDGFIGAMQNEVSSGQGHANGGKLFAHLDEFRFWKVRRTSRQIKLNWFNVVGGGANTDDNTSDLGVYLKFNEGITGNATTDATVLDYSGRIANGSWTGYASTTSARIATSAMDAAGYSETKTPIIYSTHPDVVSLTSEMQLSGSDYDSGRGQAFYRSLPSWLAQEDGQGEEDLRKLSHIMASYMDTLRVQVGALNTLADKQYYSGSQKAPPFASELLTNKGFITSDLFLSSEIFETFSNIDYTANQFNLNIDEVKNLIYLNIYNNLENIYGSKGTEKSLRNLIRCFGIDDELLRLNQYTDFGTQYLGNKSRVTSVKKKYINLNKEEHLSATMYQSGTLTFISGSHASDDAVNSAFTMEADIIVPFKKSLGENGFFPTPFLSASVMGFHEAMPTDHSNYTWWAQETATTAAATGFVNLFAAEWSVSNYEGQTITIVSTDGTSVTYEFSSTASTGDILPNGNTAAAIGGALFQTGQNGIRNAVNHANGHAGKIVASYSYQLLTLVQATAGQNGNTTIITSAPASTMSPVAFSGGTGTFAEARDLQVYLARDESESRHAKFVVKNQTGTIYLTSSYVYDIYENEHFNVGLRIKPQTYPFAGNVTNTQPDYDIELYAVSHNFDELKNEVIVSGTVNYTTGSAYLRAPKRIYAASHYENFTGSVLHKTDLQFGRVSAWLDHIPNSSIREHNKDILNYGNRKSIDGSNAFVINDVQIPSMDLSILNWDFDTVTTSDSSGDFVIEDTTSGSTDTIYGWIDNVIRREYDGKGDNFPTSSAGFLENEFLYAEKKQLPETSFNANNIFIKGDRERLFSTDDDLSDNLFILEKSPAAMVSEEMLKLFSTTQEFSNLFGRHVDRYRVEYKDLARARQLFYQRVTTGLDFDKFFTYFKWIDQSISTMINQLVPASVNFAGGVTDVVESHILERSKYQRQIGLLETVTSTEASVRGIQELRYNWKIGHAPVTGTIDNSGLDQSLWRMERQDRTSISAGVLGEQAETVRQILIRQTDQEFVNSINLSSSTGLYSGSVFATRRFSRPYSVSIEMGNNIHGGTNYSKGKDRDLLKSGVGLHSLLDASGAPKNVVTIGAGDGYGMNVDELNKKQDTTLPNEKIKYGGFGLVGKFTQFTGEYEPLTPAEDYFSRRKINTIFIGNIISSSVNTGYAGEINLSGGSGNGFRAGVNVVNLHSDTTDISNEIPMQGPFTERHIGGNQHRHIELNSVGKVRNDTDASVPNDLDCRFSRPEAWRLVVGKNPLTPDTGSLNPDADGAIGFVPADYGIGTHGYPDEDRLHAIWYREERAKRPLNIKNIQTTTSSVYHGNFQHQYEVFSTFGDKGYFLRRAESLLPSPIASTLPQTTNYATLMAQSTGELGNLQLNAPGATASNRLSGNPAKATIVACLEAAIDHSKEFTLTNAAGITITFGFNGGANISTNTSTYAVIGNRSVDIGTVGLAGQPLSLVAQQIVNRINAGTGLMDMTAQLDSATNNVIVTQGTVGTVGNKTNTDTGTGFTVGNFIDGTDAANSTPTQDRQHTGSAHVIRTRFSAPGGPEVNSPAYLDITTQERAVYNSINFRNLSVRGSGSGETGTIRVNSLSNRREGLRTLLTRHQGRFGIDSQYGAVATGSYVSEASFHKQHRNTRKVAKGTESGPVALAATATITTVVEASINTGSPSFALTNANGVTVTFKFSGGLNITTNHGSYSATSDITVEIGLVGVTSGDAGAIGDEIVTRINVGTGIDMVASKVGDNVLVTQSTLGAAGNTQIVLANGSTGLTLPAHFTGGTDTPLERFDNAHYNSLLPASDFQYSWINAAISGSNWEDGQKVLGYAPKSGIVSSSVGFDSAINFPTISDVACCILGVLEIFVDYETSEDVVYQASDGSTVEVMQFNNANEEGEVYQHDTDDIKIRANYTGCCTEALQYRVQLTAKVDGGTVGTYDSGFTTSNTPLPATSPSSSSTGAIIYDSGSGDRQVTAVFTVKDCEGNEKSTTVIFDNAKLAS